MLRRCGLTQTGNDVSVSEIIDWHDVVDVPHSRGDCGEAELDNDIEMYRTRILVSCREPRGGDSVPSQIQKAIRTPSSDAAGFPTLWPHLGRFENQPSRLLSFRGSQ